MSIGNAPIVVNAIIKQVNYVTYQITQRSLSDIINLASSINPTSGYLPAGVTVLQPLTPIETTVLQLTKLNGEILQYSINSR